MGEGGIRWFVDDVVEYVDVRNGRCLNMFSKCRSGGGEKAASRQIGKENYDTMMTLYQRRRCVAKTMKGSCPRMIPDTIERIG